MPLFQNSLVSQYLKYQNTILLSVSCETYKNHSLNLNVQKYFENFATDKQIDAMVYELFGLSNVEIKIV